MRSRYGLVGIAVALCALSCRETATRSVADAGVSCAENHKLVQGECKFVCDRDPDCGPGMRCNLLLGACEPGTPNPQPIDVTVPCTTGAERCRSDNKAVERCGAGGKWTTSKECSGEGFCLNERCLACQPGVSTCRAGDPKVVEVCLDDGSAKRTVTCASTGVCSQGECRECAPNTTRCSPGGTTVQTCQRTANETLRWEWQRSGDGVDGFCITKVCEPQGPNSARCKPPDCFPGTLTCADRTTLRRCSATGQFTNHPCAAEPGMSASAECKDGICFDECNEAVKAKSYFGCEYWSTVLDNSVDALFKGYVTNGQGTMDSDFAFVVANRSDLPTDVRVYRHMGGSVVQVKSEVVDGRTAPTKGMKVVKVPWQSIGNGAPGEAAAGIAKFGYRVTSTRPITLYQFSPLDAARISDNACTGNGEDSACNAYAQYNPLQIETWGSCRPTANGKRCHYFSYSNDASLLLPSHILGTSYVVMTPETLARTSSKTSPPSTTFSGYGTVVATQNNTVVKVKLSAKTRAGSAVGAGAPGQEQTFTLQAYDVLQLVADHLGGSYTECASQGLFGGSYTCRVPNDMTGTVISSDKPIAVFGGSACTFRPFSAMACDHVEEQMFPFNTWGKRFVAVQSHPLKLTNGAFASPSQAAPDHWKVVTGCPASTCPTGTYVRVTPASAVIDLLSGNKCSTGSLQTDDCRLMGTQSLEFRAKSNFTITADQPIAVAQFFAGQAATTSTFNPAVEGDPAMLLLPPVEQWRSSYTIMSAPGISSNYLGLSINATEVQDVIVDGVVVTGFVSVPGTSFMVKNHPVSVGTHTVEVVPKPGLTRRPGAGVTSYGFDSYVSYGYTGGLDLTPIVTGINPGG